MALPKNLEKMLEMTATDNSLLSWSIYPDKNGEEVIFKLRFGSNDSQINRDGLSFKRKTAKQVARDRTRSNAWKNRSHRDVTTARDTVDRPNSAESGTAAGATTRSKAKAHAEVETFRAEMSPVSPLDLTLPSPTPHVLDPEAPSFIATPRTPTSPDTSVCDVAPSLIVMSPTLVPCVSPGFIPMPPRSPSVDSDTSTATGVNTLLCENRGCEYSSDMYHGLDSSDTIFWCKKCSVHVCVECLDRDVHAKHRKHLDERSMLDFRDMFPE